MMKSVRAIAAAALAAMLILSTVACGKSGSSSSSSGSSESSSSMESSSSQLPAGDSMTLTEVMDDILTDVEELPMVGNIEIDAENFESYLFIKPIDNAEALVSEAMIGSIAHSVALVRLPEGADVQAVADEIKTNANPRKWICVEAEKTEVTVQGNTILLVMSDPATVDAITANFNELYQ